MATVQLAIRFTVEQLRVLDELAKETSATRSAVIKNLVDEAAAQRVRSRYVQGYKPDQEIVDDYGNLSSFHNELELERVQSRTDEAGW